MNKSRKNILIEKSSPKHECTRRLMSGNHWAICVSRFGRNLSAFCCNRRPLAPFCCCGPAFGSCGCARCSRFENLDCCTLFCPTFSMRLTNTKSSQLDELCDSCSWYFCIISITFGRIRVQWPQSIQCHLTFDGNNLTQSLFLFLSVRHTNGKSKTKKNTKIMFFSSSPPAQHWKTLNFNFECV